jgi:hypothetical protein
MLQFSSRLCVEVLVQINSPARPVSIIPVDPKLRINVQKNRSSFIIIIIHTYHLFIVN